MIPHLPQPQLGSKLLMTIHSSTDRFPACLVKYSLSQIYEKLHKGTSSREWRGGGWGYWRAVGCLKSSYTYENPRYEMKSNSNLWPYKNYYKHKYTWMVRHELIMSKRMLHAQSSHQSFSPSVFDPVGGGDSGNEFSVFLQWSINESLQNEMSLDYPLPKRCSTFHVEIET